MYTTPEAADLLHISERTLIEEISKRLIEARNVGKGWKILGENLLSYMGSPSIQQMQPNVKDSNPIMQDDIAEDLMVDNNDSDH